MRRLLARRVQLMWMLVVALVLTDRGGGLAGQPSGQDALVRGDLDVWVVDSLTRVRPDDPPRRDIGEVRLKAAKNEAEATQVVLRSRVAQRNVTVDVTDLMSEGGQRIDKNDVNLFREHYIRVTHSSPQSPFPPGWWPDALIPFRDPENHRPIKGGRFPASLFDLRPHENQPIWVEVSVPPTAEAGVYRGAIRVIIDGRPVISVPLLLEVWDFTLPTIPTIRSHFGDFRRIAEFYHVAPGSSAYLQMARRYENALIRHRLMPKRPEATEPQVATDGTIDTAKFDAAMTYYVNQVGINSWQIPLGPHYPFPDTVGADRERTKQYLRNLCTAIDSHGWANLAYFYPVDEPNSPDAYQRVRDFAMLAHEAHPGIDLILTESPRPRPSNWGALFDSVSVWVILFGHFNEAEIVERQAAGQSVWAYTALTDQGPPTLPHWALDFPLLDYRIPLWISWRYKLTGLLYWTTVFWSRVVDPWTEPNTYPQGQNAFNGEGILFYPGTAVGYEGPVPSMRLKAIRDGMEDYEYLKLLTESGDSVFADETAYRIGRSWSDWERNSGEVLKMRERLAARIIERQRGAVRGK